MNRRILILVLLIPLLATACIGESEEVTRAKADYIQNKAQQIALETRRQGIEVDSLEQEIAYDEALQAQRLEQEWQNTQAAQKRRATLEKILAETLRVLACFMVATVVVVSMSWAISGAHEAWTQQRVKLLEASQQEAQARAQAMKEERLAQTAKIKAFELRRSLMQAEAKRLEQESQLLTMKSNGNGRSGQPVADPEQRLESREGS